jgi:hypothetical protein
MSASQEATMDRLNSDWDIVVKTESRMWRAL